MRSRLALVVATLTAGSISRHAPPTSAADPARPADLAVGDTRFHYPEAGRGP
jgi:hypothetical protein